MYVVETAEYGTEQFKDRDTAYWWARGFPGSSVTYIPDSDGQETQA
jgi:hypothetical protein